MVETAQWVTKKLALHVQQQQKEHYARRLTRAYNICPSIRQVLTDDVT